MIALAAFAWKNRVILAVGALMLSALAYHKAEVSSAYRAGGAAARAEIEAANRAALEKADKAARDLDACPPGRWNRRTGTCDP